MILFLLIFFFSNFASEHLQALAPIDYLPKNRLHFYKEALEEVKADAKWKVLDYSFSPFVKDLLEYYHIDVNNYTVCRGNQFQQLIHKECITLLIHLVNMQNSLEHKCYFLMPFIVAHAELAREHNQLGLAKKAVMFLSLGWKLVDCAQKIHNNVKFRFMPFCILNKGFNEACALQAKEVIPDLEQYAHEIAEIAQKIIEIGMNRSFDSYKDHNEIWENKWEKISYESALLKNYLKPIRLNGVLAQFDDSFAKETVLFERTMGTYTHWFKKGISDILDLMKTIKNYLDYEEGKDPSDYMIFETSW